MAALARRLALVLFAAALLLAQQAALTHQVWHLGGEGSAPHAVALSAGEDNPSDPAQARLCDLHSALGVVLGALDCGAAAAAPGTPAEPLFVVAAHPAASIPHRPPASRGPPAFL